MTKELRNLMLSLGGFIITSLLAGNVFFLVRQIDRVDKMEDTLWHVRQEVAVLSSLLNTHKN